jgi:choline kinase
MFLGSLGSSFLRDTRHQAKKGSESSKHDYSLSVSGTPNSPRARENVPIDIEQRLDLGGEARPKYEVIILAAGTSSRALPVTKGFPKCLLTVKGKTILRHQIDSLRMYGVEMFTVVAGYKHDRITPFLRNENIRLILNPDYEGSGSLYSLWLTKRTYEHGIIIINSDVYMPSQLAGKMVCSESENAALVDTSAEWDGESTKVKIRDGRIVLWSRDLTKTESSGENIGVVRIIKKDVWEFYRVVDALINRGSKDKWWPDALNQFATSRTVVPIETGAMFCIEIDTLRDYYKALKRVNGPACR